MTGRSEQWLSDYQSRMASMRSGVAVQVEEKPNAVRSANQEHKEVLARWRATPDDVVMSSYERTQNMERTGREFGVSLAAVHRRLIRITGTGRPRKGNQKDAPARLTDITCAQCATIFKTSAGEYEKKGRKYCSPACQAEARTSPPPPREELFELYVSQKLSMNVLSARYGVSDMTVKKWLAAHTIPVRRMGESVSIAQIGKFHTDAWNQAISAAHRARGSWLGEDHPNFRFKECWKSNRSKGGKRADLDDLYVRSRWEANVARYLNWLLERHDIQRWDYEPECFEFKEIKRGSKFYTPDFRVKNNDGSTIFWEVKGYMDAASRTKLDRMAQYYPSISIWLIEAKEYRAIAKSVAALIPGWETQSPKPRLERLA